jgi:hypothetical protein
VRVTVLDTNDDASIVNTIRKVKITIRPNVKALHRFGAPADEEGIDGGGADRPPEPG